MSLPCIGVVPRDGCGDVNACRVGPDRTQSAIAIVIHLLQGIGPEAYNDFLQTPCKNFKCDNPPNCPQFVGSTNPQSVHFLLTDTGTIQYAELSRITYGIDYLFQPTWPDVNQLGTNINERLIHVAVASQSLLTTNLINLLCCIGIDLGTDLPIIAASDLQADRPELILNPSIAALVSNCIVSGGVTPPPSIFDLEDRIEELEACCTNNTSDIIVLQGQVISLNNRTLNLETKVAALENKVTQLFDITAVIPALTSQVQTLINQVNDILSRCCPATPQAVCWNYQLLPGDEMLVTPNQPVWLNLPTKIEDREVSCGNGNIVLPGPLWQANLCKTDLCGTVICSGNWSLEAIVRFRLASWCNGRKASLYLVACGKKYLIAEQVITTTAQQQVTLTGEFLLPGEPCCSDVHLLVATNDDNTTSAKIVEFASFKGCCT